MARAKIIAAVVMLLLAVVVVIQNTQTVETKLLFITLEMPRAVLLLLTFGLGAVAGLLVAFSLSGKKKE